MTERPSNDDILFARTIGELGEGMRGLRQDVGELKTDLKSTNARLEEVAATLHRANAVYKAAAAIITILGAVGMGAVTLFAGYFNSKGHP